MTVFILMIYNFVFVRIRNKSGCNKSMRIFRNCFAAMPYPYHMIPVLMNSRLDYVMIIDSPNNSAFADFIVSQFTAEYDPAPFLRMICVVFLREDAEK